MTIDASADETAIVSAFRVRQVVQGLLRGAQAAGWTDDSLAAATGLKKTRIKSYRVEGKEPSLSAALSIACVLGQRSVNAVIAIIGYGGAEPLEDGDAKSPGEIVADCIREIGVIAGAGVSGRFDHTTKPQVEHACDMIIAELIPLSSAGKAA